MILDCIVQMLPIDSHQNTMETIQSPVNIEVLLHCYTTPGPHPRLDTPAVSLAISSLKHAGAIMPTSEDEYETTKLGEAWVKALCNVPPPRSVFVDQQGNIIETNP